MYTAVVDLITLLLSWLSDPADESEVEQWIQHAHDAVDLFECTPCEHRIIAEILQRCEEQHRARIRRALPLDDAPLNHDPMSDDVSTGDDPLHDEKDEKDEKEDDSALTAELDALLQKEQIEQRTPEWYAQMATVLSASEIYKILNTPYQRGQMVLSKTRPPEPRNQALAVFSSHMSAFDWGIRFEPIVKQIYEDMHGSVVKEMGRLHHPTVARCTASPDGLIYSSTLSPETRGHLIEIKCPVTREIQSNKIKPEYYAQMQLQMQVTGRPACEFVEAVFSSAYNQMEQRDGPGLYSGWIALVRRSPPPSSQAAADPMTTEDTLKRLTLEEDMAPISGQYVPNEFTYVYSPLHAQYTWRPVLADQEEIVELIPWTLYQWNEQRVMRNEEWWAATRAAMDAFWVDVERAKQGAYDAPEPSRQSKKPRVSKNEASLFQFHRMDEDGQPYD